MLLTVWHDIENAMMHLDQRTIAVAVSIGTSLFVAMACAMVAIFSERKKDDDE